MKKFSYLIMNIVLILTILFVGGCKKNDDKGPSIEDQAGANFEGTWVVGNSGSVFFGNDDRTSGYSGFTLHISYDHGQGSGSFQATGGQEGSSPWPPSGTWEFLDTPSSATSFKVKRLGDELEIKVSLTETDMTLDFQFDSSKHNGDLGRVQEVTGMWTFNLEKQ